MYVLLNRNIALRAYQLVPYSYITKTSQIPNKLSKRQFDVLMLADGMHDIPVDETVKELLKINVIKECKKNEAGLTKWQEFRCYDNRLVPAMNLEITGLCNYNCLHCFNATDNKALQSHMSLEQVLNILDQALSCGITAFTITGGEPLIHKDIKEIIKAIYERNMFVKEINTNGSVLNQEFLDYLKTFNYPTLIKISFDGVGFHDTIRQYKGAEKSAIEAFKLCVKNGFPTMAQVNVNKNNIGTIPDTLELLDTLKVNKIRLIRTAESPRWKQNNGQSLSLEEYFDSMLEMVEEYIKKPRYSEIIVWQYLNVFPKTESYSIEPVNSIRLSQPVCKGNRGMVAIGANGNLYPCLQMSGAFDEYGVVLGNIFNDSLHDLLQTESEYMKNICKSVEEKAEENRKCLKCRYLKYCGAGCPAMSLSYSLVEKNEFNLTYTDKMRCYFFENDYYHKITNALSAYQYTGPYFDL